MQRIAQERRTASRPSRCRIMSIAAWSRGRRLVGPRPAFLAATAPGEEHGLQERRARTGGRRSSPPGTGRPRHDGSESSRRAAAEEQRRELDRDRNSMCAALPADARDVCAPRSSLRSKSRASLRSRASACLALSLFSPERHKTFARRRCRILASAFSLPRERSAHQRLAIYADDPPPDRTVRRDPRRAPPCSSLTRGTPPDPREVTQVLGVHFENLAREQIDSRHARPRGAQEHGSGARRARVVDRRVARPAATQKPSCCRRTWSVLTQSAITSRGTVSRRRVQSQIVKMLTTKTKAPHGRYRGLTSYA
ncbi:hypothetical protein Q5P01_000783 [Channa striata]|uniref:Uncharacterized protein n=1 Tax=Channa striata TaxID=64152 RepID=A0AA88IKN9_CHASR|nr:hypothetical protein Q5P01_000783 [Channa striata]